MTAAAVDNDDDDQPPCSSSSLLLMNANPEIKNLILLLNVLSQAPDYFTAT